MKGILSEISRTSIESPIPLVVYIFNVQTIGLGLSLLIRTSRHSEVTWCFAVYDGLELNDCFPIHQLIAA